MRVSIPRTASARLMFGVVLIMGALLGGAPDARCATDGTVPETADELLSVYQGAGRDGRPFTILHDEFPDEWKIFSVEVLRRLPNTARANTYADRFIADLIKSRLDKIYVAPGDALKTLAEGERFLLFALRDESVQSCTDYLDKGAMPKSTWSDKVTQERRNYMAAALLAIRAGAETPTEHGRLTPVDIGPVAIAFSKKGGTTEQWEALVEADTSKLSIEGRCEAWLAYYAAMENVPDEIAGRFLAIQYRPAGPDEPEDAPQRPK